MSVVNDVLKNLEKRQVKKNMHGNNAFMIYPGSKENYLFWGMVCLSFSLVVSVSVFSYVWVNSSGFQQVSVLPYDLLLAQEQNTTESQGYDKSSKLTPVNIDKYKEQSQSVAKTTRVIKTQRTQASENAIDAINNGNTEQARQSLSKSTANVQDQVKLRLMLKDNPQDVLGYIQNNYQYQNSPPLIAMAAQGQQRSGQHKSAVVLYRKLIRIQPNNAKWRSGIAISYEILGMAQKAKSSYRLALSMPNLPIALRVFSEERLQNLL